MLVEVLKIFQHMNKITERKMNLMNEQAIENMTNISVIETYVVVKGYKFYENCLSVQEGRYVGELVSALNFCTHVYSYKHNITRSKRFSQNIFVLPDFQTIAI